MLEDAKFVKQAVQEGVKDIISAYNESIDKFVADPDVRIAIKIAAGAGVLQRIFARLQNATPAAETKQESTKVEEPEADPHVWPLGDLSGWTKDQF